MQWEAAAAKQEPAAAIINQGSRVPDSRAEHPPRGMCPTRWTQLPRRPPPSLRAAQALAAWTGPSRGSNHCCSLLLRQHKSWMLDAAIRACAMKKHVHRAERGSSWQVGAAKPCTWNSFPQCQEGDEEYVRQKLQPRSNAAPVNHSWGATKSEMSSCHMSVNMDDAEADQGEKQTMVPIHSGILFGTRSAFVSANMRGPSIKLHALTKLNSACILFNTEARCISACTQQLISCHHPPQV